MQLMTYRRMRGPLAALVFVLAGSAAVAAGAAEGVIDTTAVPGAVVETL